MKTKKDPGTIHFEFQEIPLQEAQVAVLSGDGKYSQIKEMLLTKLPTLPPDKAFAFGLGNGTERNSSQRYGIPWQQQSVSY